MRPHQRNRCGTRILAIAAATLPAACSTPPAPVPPPGDHLIVAITDEYGDLDPIARYADGAWDQPPWAVPVRLNRLVAAPNADSSAWRWPDGRRIWPSSARAWDSIGHPVQAVAVNVPDQWHFHSDSVPDQTLVTHGLHLTPMHPCGFAWSVRTRTDRGEPFPHLGDFRTAGVSLSRAPSAVLTADAAPDIERVLSELGLQDEESNTRYDPRFTWLGVFQFDGMTIGVLHRLGYGLGVMHAVIELQGDNPRVVSVVRRGQC